MLSICNLVEKTSHTQMNWDFSVVSGVSNGILVILVVETVSPNHQ